MPCGKFENYFDTDDFEKSVPETSEDAFYEEQLLEAFGK